MSRPIAFSATYGFRLLHRFFPDLLCRLPYDRKVAYLTFDDGPTRELTDALLQILDRHNAKATFFMIGRHVEHLPELARAVHAAGHTIGNHSYAHPDPWAISAPALIRDLERTTAVLEDIIERPVRWMRPPYGRFTRALRDWCNTRRQRMTMWDIMPADYLIPTTAALLQQRIQRALRPGSIIVLHDNPKTLNITPPALDRLLPRLIDQGWRFDALPVRHHGASAGS